MKEQKINSILNAKQPQHTPLQHTNIPSLDSTKDEETFMHGKQSTLPSSALKKSKYINATNAVTCRKKSSRTARATKERQIQINVQTKFQIPLFKIYKSKNQSPANIEKTRHAGIGIKLPTANAKTSDKLASVMDGPTSTSALLIRLSKGNSSDCRFMACTNIHMLSTPT